MRLPFTRTPAALVLTPASVQPTGTVRVQATLGKALEGVTGARFALGYECTYPYRWAGRRDAMAGHDDASLLANDIGTDHGSDRNATDWVLVLATELAVADGRLEPGELTAELRVPSWAPGSSRRMVRWLASRSP